MEKTIKKIQEKNSELKEIKNDEKTTKIREKKRRKKLEKNNGK